MPTRGKGSKTDEGEAPAPASPIPLKDIYSQDFQEDLKGKAEEWQSYLKKKVQTDILETEDEKLSKYLEKVKIREHWRNRVEETENFENLDITTLQGAVALHSDFAQLKKDEKQIEVVEKKRALREKKDELKGKMEKLKKAAEALEKISKRMSDLKESIPPLQEEIDGKEEELHEARETRKDEDRRLVKRLKEYLTEMRLPEPAKSEEAPFSDEGDAEPEPDSIPSSPGSDIEFDTDESAEKEPPAAPKKKGKKKAATVEDGED